MHDDSTCTTGCYTGRIHCNPHERGAHTAECIGVGSHGMNWPVLTVFALCCVVRAVDGRGHAMRTPCGMHARDDESCRAERTTVPQRLHVLARGPTDRSNGGEWDARMIGEMNAHSQ